MDFNQIKVLYSPIILEKNSTANNTKNKDTVIAPNIETLIVVITVMIMLQKNITTPQC